jgi:hypothetical protein
MILLPLGNSLNISNANAIADFDIKVDKKQVSLSSLKCINTNININGVNSGDIKSDNNGQKATNSFGNGEGYSYYDNKLFDCSVSNKNTNTNLLSISGGGSNGNQTIPPTPPGPPEPTPATLTVKKQVSGCVLSPFSERIMDCQNLRDNSTDWLDCNNSSINNTVHCQSAPESIFDIEVLDDQGVSLLE